MLVTRTSYYIGSRSVFGTNFLKNNNTRGEMIILRRVIFNLLEVSFPSDSTFREQFLFRFRSIFQFLPLLPVYEKTEAEPKIALDKYYQCIASI